VCIKAVEKEDNLYFPAWQHQFQALFSLLVQHLKEEGLESPVMIL